MNTKLYIENLPASATEATLKELFSKHGAVSEVKLVIDPASGISRGRAFVTMANEEGASAALTSLRGFTLGGRNVAVNEARPQPESPSGLIGHGFDLGRSANGSGAGGGGGGGGGHNHGHGHEQRRPQHRRHGGGGRRRR